MTAGSAKLASSPSAGWVDGVPFLTDAPDGVRIACPSARGARPHTDGSGADRIAQGQTGMDGV